MLCYSQRTPKRGNSASEYEDACDGDLATGRWAVADGATESAFAEPWARGLVEGFVRSPSVSPRRWGEWLPPIQRRWAQEVGQRPLVWYLEAKFLEGAFAAFIGLTLGPGRCGVPGLWRAVAVGDSCLFHVRGRTLLRSFPVTGAEQFGNNPWLVGSRATPASVQCSRARGRWEDGDQLFLMTDALARWFLERREQGGEPWETVLDVLRGPEPAEAFRRWVEALREGHAIRNDDVTVIAIES
jgi:hypothetical protein